MSIRDELLSIQKRDPKGILHVDQAVAWARRNPGSALHDALEWDNETAAEAHRFWQVRQLIQLHIVTAEGQPEMVSLTIDRYHGGGYRPTEDVMRVPDLRQIMLADALAELERVQAKYQRVVELKQVWEAAEAARLAAPELESRTRTRRRREPATV